MCGSQVQSTVQSIAQLWQCWRSYASPTEWRVCHNQLTGTLDLWVAKEGIVAVPSVAFVAAVQERWLASEVLPALGLAHLRLDLRGTPNGHFVFGPPEMYEAQPLDPDQQRDTVRRMAEIGRTDGRPPGILVLDLAGSMRYTTLCFMVDPQGTPVMHVKVPDGIVAGIICEAKQRLQEVFR